MLRNGEKAREKEKQSRKRLRCFNLAEEQIMRSRKKGMVNSSNKW